MATSPPPNNQPTTPPTPDAASLEKARAALEKVGNTAAGIPQTGDTAPRNSRGTRPAEAKSGRLGTKLPTVNLGKSWKTYAAIAGGILLAGVGIYLGVFYPGQITLTTTPDYATITAGSTTATGSAEIRRWPGTVPVTVNAPGYVPFSDIITIGAGERKTRAITLREIPSPIRLSERRIQFPILDSERSSLLFLDPSEDTAYRLSLSNLAQANDDVITPSVLRDLTDLIWSPNRQLAFLKQGGTTKLYDFKRYDLVNQTTTDWPAGIGAIDWRPDGEKVAYYYEPGDGERSLIRATKDNSEVERLYNFAEDSISNPKLAWSPDAKYIAVWTDQLYLFDVFAKTLTPVEGVDATDAVRWLPTSTGLIAQTKTNALLHITTDAISNDLNRPGAIDQLIPLADGKGFVQATTATNGTVALEHIALNDGAATPYATTGLTGLTPTNLMLDDGEQTLYFTAAGQPYAIALDTGEYSQ